MPLNNSNRPVRNVSVKDLIVMVLVVSYLLAALTIYNLYSNLAGGLMFGVAGVVIFLTLMRLPKDDKNAIGAAILKQEKTPIGKVMKSIEYVLYVILSIALLSWIVSKLR